MLVSPGLQAVGKPANSKALAYFLKSPLLFNRPFATCDLSSRVEVGRCRPTILFRIVLGRNLHCHRFDCRPTFSHPRPDVFGSGQIKFAPDVVNSPGLKLSLNLDHVAKASLSLFGLNR